MMTQKHRIHTNIGGDQKINVELNQNFDLLEILSLKFTQKDLYSSLCSDYGVVVGRVTVNNGFGVPNAKVSIFVPLTEEDEEDPVISGLYPYKSPSDVNEEGFRYNLLPARKQHGGHEATGTFPDQLDILNREEILEVYDKYYKYTVKTNDSGDFMIWGIPIGEQILHIDLDLSDIGCFSLRPHDFIVDGYNVGEFKNSYEFNSGPNIDALPQIKRMDKTIEVFPFWGNPEFCNISITRSDFDLNDFGVSIEPKAYLIGGSYTDSQKMSINKNCLPQRKMGKKCELITKTGTVESIRFTNQYDQNNNPVLEYKGDLGEIDSDGSFLISVPMNMDYIYTNEFGENEYTTDTSVGIPTGACYRFRLSLNEEDLDRTRTLGSYLVPNIREYDNDKDKSYNFSTSFDDYPQDSKELILNVEDGFYTPKDYFFRLTYNKVYTVSSFQSTHFNGYIIDRERFLGLKDLVPSDNNDCNDSVLTPPVNFAIRNKSFELIISDILLFLEYSSILLILTVYNILVLILSRIGSVVSKMIIIKNLGEWFYKIAYELQESGQRKLHLTTYPECDECNDEEDSDEFDDRVILDNNDTTNYCKVGVLTLIGDDTGKVMVNGLNQTGVTCDSVIIYSSDSEIELELTTNFNNYFIEDQDNISGQIYFYIEGGALYFDDINKIYSQNGTFYYVDLFSSVILVIDPNDEGHTYIEMESGCDLYDKPYDETIVKHYYDQNHIPINYVPGVDIAGAVLSDDGENLIKTGLYTKSGDSEFSNGIFYIIPGTQSTNRLWSILREYYRRKRIGIMFCGGVVNYAFIDNWLSGSLYFYQFKSKFKEKKDKTKIKFCDKLITYNDNDNHFYYRSTVFNKNLGFLGYNDNNIKRLGRPTTMVDLGPRDGFIKEICVDKNIDPNCSVSRSIGSSSFQDFGELLGYAINYRLEISDNKFKLSKFFDNSGFSAYGFSQVLDGDILQLISINNETGIEEFDIQNPNYGGYSFQFLDPQLYPDIFKRDGVFGPLPITQFLSESGVKIRSCLNQTGFLTESSQTVPFYLWDKKGTGFGPYNSQMDAQSWDYNNIEQQSLQGMYNVGRTTLDQPGEPIDDSKFLLLPITYEYSGRTINLPNILDGTPEFNVISTENLSPLTFTDAYPGFTYLSVISGTEETPIGGVLWTKFGTGNTMSDWDYTNWTEDSFVIRKTQDYYTTNKQILSTPFMFYFGLRPGKTGLDKFIRDFGNKDFFNPIG